MNFLTQGEKIKATRKYLKMKQQDLQDEEISRGLISMIEIGKRALTEEVAIKIFDKFYKRSNELGLDLNIDVNYFLRSPIEDAELFVLDKLEQATFPKEIEEVINLTNDYNFNILKAKAYMKLGDYYFENKDYKNSFANYNNSINIYRNNDNNEFIPYLYWKIGLCKAITLNLEEAILYFNFSYQYSVLYKDTKIEKKILYNLSKCYKNFGKIDLSLNYINKYLSLCNKADEFDYYIYANILKANCYEINKEFDIVINIYNSLLEEFDNDNNALLGYIYNNLGLAYMHKNNFEKSNLYFEKAEKIRINFDQFTLSQTLIEKSNLYIKQNLYNEAIQSIKSGILSAQDYKNYEELIKGYYLLADIYSTIDDNINLKDTYLLIADLLKEVDHKKDLVLIYNKLSILYLKENDMLKARHFLELSVNICNNI